MSKIRTEFYQTDAEVVVSVFIKHVQADQLKVELQQNSVSLAVTLPSGTDVVFDLDPLSHPINVELSSHRVSPVKIELKLSKKDIGVKWIKLEREQDDAGDATTTMQPSSAATSKPSYPTSSRNRTNWDAFVRNTSMEEEAASKETSKDVNATGDADVNALFQTLYAGATDEQRRAMVKSYQESNGTALSTDWDTVKVGTVETCPPDSMIARKWNGTATKASGNNVL